jgi:hypothetical protein
MTQGDTSLIPLHQTSFRGVSVDVGNGGDPGGGTSVQNGDWIPLDGACLHGLALDWTPGSATSVLIGLEVQVEGDTKAYTVWTTVIGTPWTVTLTGAVTLYFPVHLVASGGGQNVRGVTRVRVTYAFGATPNASTDLQATVCAEKVAA